MGTVCSVEHVPTHSSPRPDDLWRGSESGINTLSGPDAVDVPSRLGGWLRPPASSI